MFAACSSGTWTLRLACSSFATSSISPAYFLKSSALLRSDFWNEQSQMPLRSKASSLS